MNSTQNKTSDYLSFYTLEYILENFAGSTWITDTFNVWPFVVLGPVAITLNAFAFLVLRNTQFTIDMFKYMSVYMANNAILSLMLSFQWINSSYRVIPWTNSYMGQALAIYFMGTTANVLYFFGSLIDVFLLLDRIAIFKPHIKRFFILPPYKMCLLAFVLVIVIDSPYYFFQVVASETYKLNATTSYTVWFYENSNFANSQLGKILIYTLIVIREVLVTLTQIILNLVSIFYFRQYAEKKRTIMNDLALALPTLDSKKMPSLITNHHSIPNIRNYSTKTAASNPRISFQPERHHDEVSSADTRATIMCILMCMFTVVEHLLFFASIVFPYVSSNYFFLSLLNACSFLWQVLKRIADFFLLLFFNLMFKKACLKIVRVKI
jgi:hypothetical protein